MYYDLFLDLKVTTAHVPKVIHHHSRCQDLKCLSFLIKAKQLSCHSWSLCSSSCVIRPFTLTKVRYVLDFGIVRKMVFDEERAMQSTWHVYSKAAKFVTKFSDFSLDKYLDDPWCNSRYLIDLRMTGAFVTHGALKQLADKATLPHFAWRSLVKNVSNTASFVLACEDVSWPCLDERPFALHRSLRAFVASFCISAAVKSMLPGRGRCGRLQEGVWLLKITDSPMTCLKIGRFANGHYSKAEGNCVAWNGQQLNWQLQRWVKLVNWSSTPTEVLRSKRP